MTPTDTLSYDIDFRQTINFYLKQVKQHVFSTNRKI